ncbi:VOC family protein [Isoptericola sp. 4D.3]|uniref:VOC family protein n=1 Tax=Isoptericola peretonis TaxID=2918523 RepID=A0ABT0J4I3_9MICO|nr:VOC family protein [Isoptericola sp. 4D.3]
MTSRTYPHGVPCWLDLETPAVDAAVAFYGALFGWRFTEKLPPGVPARYVVASLDGTDATAVAAFATPDPAVPAEGPPAWNTYLAVDDAEASARRVIELGGQVVTPPEQVGPPGAAAGTMVRFRDPQGAPGRLWQAGTRLGAQVVNAPGTWNFSDLVTPDPDGALAFYGALLGWEVDPQIAIGMARVPGYGDHLAATTDPDIHDRQDGVAPPGFADAVAGIGTTDGPARWSVVFAVVDRDVSAQAARDAGGTVTSTEENEWVRTASVRDPLGAELVLSQFAPQHTG